MTLGVALLGAAWGARAEQDGASLSRMEQRLNALEEEVRVLRQQIADAKTTAAPAGGKAATNETSVLSVGSEGVAMKSADGNFQMRMGGLLQTDARFFLHDNAAFRDTFLIRRARPILEATVFQEFGFRLTPEFAGSSMVLLDASAEWKRWPWLTFRAGKFKPPLGLELLQNDPDREFTEAAFTTALMPNRDIGFQLGGSIPGGALGYALGVFNGAPDGSSTFETDLGDHKDAVARVFAQPFRETNLPALRKLGVGVAGSIGKQETTAATANLPGNKTPGQQTFFSYRPTGFSNGERHRLVPQADYFYGPFGLLGEYVIEEQTVFLGPVSDRLRHEAWQITGSWVLTGEEASYSGVNPKHPFHLPTGNWGAWEMVARYHEFDADPAAFPKFADPASAARAAAAWGVGLNWYLNRNVRMNLHYEQTRFEGGAASGARPTERVIFTRLQLKY